jgi:dTDP-4-amino-4,6-dideoxygalactose transaminase
MKNIPYTKHKIFKSDIKNVIKSLQNDYITQGKYVDKLEKKITSSLKVKYALSCSSGTAAIHMALVGLGVSRNDNVIVPVVNFIAITNVLKILGANIFYADVDSLTGQMTPKSLKNCIKINKIKNIKAFCTMYLGGNPENIINFYKLKKKYKCYLIEDACHALGSKYFFKNWNSIGSCKHSDVCTFSLHPAKTITSGEGGIVTTNNFKIYQTAKLFRSHGMKKDNKKIYQKINRYWDYDIKSVGLNYRLSDINASLALSQFSKINKIIRMRNYIANMYIKSFSDCGFVEVQKISKTNFSAWHLFVIKIKNINNLKQKELFFKYLIKKNILAQQHYIPIFKYSVSKKISEKDFNGAQNYHKNSFSLPIFYDLPLKYVNIISHIIKNYFNEK